MEPVFYGGDMNARFNKDGEMLLKDTPVKFEAGTPNIEGVIGTGAAIQYLLSIGLDNIHEYEKELRAYAIDKLSQLDNIEIINPDNLYGPIDFNAKVYLHKMQLDSSQVKILRLDQATIVLRSCITLFIQISQFVLLYISTIQKKKLIVLLKHVKKLH